MGEKMMCKLVMLVSLTVGIGLSPALSQSPLPSLSAEDDKNLICAVLSGAAEALLAEKHEQEEVLEMQAMSQYYQSKLVSHKDNFKGINSGSYVIARLPTQKERSDFLVICYSEFANHRPLSNK